MRGTDDAWGPPVFCRPTGPVMVAPLGSEAATGFGESLPLLLEPVRTEIPKAKHHPYRPVSDVPVGVAFNQNRRMPWRHKPIKPVRPQAHDQTSGRCKTCGVQNGNGRPVGRWFFNRRTDRIV